MSNDHTGVAQESRIKKKAFANSSSLKALTFRIEPGVTLHIDNDAAAHSPVRHITIWFNWGSDAATTVDGSPSFNRSRVVIDPGAFDKSHELVKRQRVLRVDASPLTVVAVNAEKDDLAHLQDILGVEAWSVGSAPCKVTLPEHGENGGCEAVNTSVVSLSSCYHDCKPGFYKVKLSNVSLLNITGTDGWQSVCVDGHFYPTRCLPLKCDVDKLLVQLEQAFFNQHNTEEMFKDFKLVPKAGVLQYGQTARVVCRLTGKTAHNITCDHAAWPEGYKEDESCKETTLVCHNTFRFLPTLTEHWIAGDAKGVCITPRCEFENTENRIHLQRFMSAAQLKSQMKAMNTTDYQRIGFLPYRRKLHDSGRWDECQSNFSFRGTVKFDRLACCGFDDNSKALYVPLAEGDRGCDDYKPATDFHFCKYKSYGNNLVRMSADLSVFTRV